MTLVVSVKTCLSKYATWQGRASRSEFWYFNLFSFLCSLLAQLIDNVLGITFKFTNELTGQELSSNGGYIQALVVLGMFLPQLAVLVRRLHDTNRSGWWYWLLLVPVIGGILLLVWFCSAGTTGENSYGPDSRRDKAS
jgi:uncharacterized membrane protein YhaH (DUF805 family)